jgi:UDP-2-acetamido-2-deoxy-ribo-hexuluronate aminotransferase
MKINFCDLRKQYEILKKNIDEGINKVLSHSKFINGFEVEELEKKLSEYVGTKYAISVASGTDALLLSLLALDIKQGDFVITTPFTFIATAEVISFLKAIPVFVDIDEKTLNISPEKIKKFLENPINPIDKNPIKKEKIKAIISVDLFGQPADYDELKKICRENNLFLIEDGCQSLGAEQDNKKACSFGDISVTSFFPSKPLGCYGDGGMIFTDSEELLKKCRLLRNHGQEKKYSHESLGLNSRLDTIQASILLAKLGWFEEEIKKRQEIAQRYKEKLKDLTLKFPEIRENNISSYAQFCILTEKRDELKRFLERNEIPIAVHYPKPLHLQKAFSLLNYQEGDFPIAEKVSKQILSLPFDAYKTNEEIEFICEKLGSFLGN